MAEWQETVAALRTLVLDTVHTYPIASAIAASGLASTVIVVASVRHVVIGKRINSYQQMHDEEKAGGQKAMGARSLPKRAKTFKAFEPSPRVPLTKKREDEKAAAATKEKERITAEREMAEAELARLREKAKNGQLSAWEQATLNKADEKAMELQVAEMDMQAKLTALRKDVVEQELAEYRRAAIKRLAVFKGAKQQRDATRLAKGEVLPGEILEVHSPVKDSLPQFVNLAPGVVLASSPTGMILTQASVASPPNAPPTASGFVVSYANQFPLGYQKAQPSPAIVEQKASSSGGWFGIGRSSSPAPKDAAASPPTRASPKPATGTNTNVPKTELFKAEPRPKHVQNSR